MRLDQAYIDRVLATWKLITDPIRPSRDEIAHMRRELLSDGPRPRTLVLGVTPELVDMVLDAGASRTLVMEIRAEAIQAMRQLAQRPWDGAEFVLGDWRDHRPELDGQFDVVIGHGTLLFLKHPDEWRAAIEHFRRYLADGGLLILRTFLMPPGGAAFDKTYHRILDRFDRVAAGRDEESRLRLFMEATTDVRNVAILEAVLPDGSVSPKRLTDVMIWVTADLRRRYAGQPIWDIMGPEFETPMPEGYDEVWPLATLTWERTRDSVAACGFDVRVEFIGDRPHPGCFCVLTGKKRHGVAPERLA